ncbi:sugar-binding protein [Paramaledivibacter caminithermalis]|jgi:ribose transport system substrate-binding protein|uniref:Monosaccharide ABC transporter substrate-binding protein, CUT2 family (TC 3.A.1.2.-) n=1 Tax=Paramaledivibacter caminithermalis (strain DSM 15212 / CIP 107654 / DViRD3) TaxID=1121301 RepID=A0A1M6RWE9_PARC5|nr:sugar-binding protein [Paramaledivibacter caminithermalis]SHK36783.1 monosaccharide ABC transporter substrate-binding protein, CUT2 family (TC 3.A.1.2.-) [Paramaledivibacter caminithermalis DSM 15212]
MKEFNKRHFSIMKKIIIILLILIVAISINLYRLKKKSKIPVTKNPKYHFFMIAKNSVDPFWKSVKQGAEKAAKDFNIAIEFYAPRFNNPEEEQKYLDIAILSNVDGIIAHSNNTSEFDRLINKAYVKGIPVVSIENDAPKSNRKAFVGTNSFVLGQEAAKLMIEATGGIANIGIIVSNGYNLSSEERQSMEINGFLSTIKNYSNMKLVKIYKSEMGILGAEEITQKIIDNNEKIDAIYTTNSIDTLGSAQIIVENNKVGDIVMVGYGDTEKILRYIKNGIIYGTVMSYPFEMGYESVKALVNIKEKNNTSNFIDTGVKVITRENVDEYHKNTRVLE